MWTCPRCGRSFANKNQPHTCAALRTVEEHLEGKPAAVVGAYEAFVAAVRACGPVELLPEKTRIAFHTRMSFAALTIRSRWIDGHLILARRIEQPRWRRIESFSPRNHLHAFRLTAAEDVDDRLREWIAEAYEVGLQHHLSEG